MVDNLANCIGHGSLGLLRDVLNKIMMMGALIRKQEAGSNIAEFEVDFDLSAVLLLDCVLDAVLVEPLDRLRVRHAPT